MGIKIALSNHKGGVGKSTIVINLSSYMLKYFKKNLVVDFDPQANTTWALCEYASEIRYKIEDILRYGVGNDTDNDEVAERFEELVRQATVDMIRDDGQISLIGSSLALSQTKLELSKYESVVYFRIIDIIRKISKNYDLILIDTPPSIEMLTASAVTASDYIIMPITLDLLAMNGAMDIKQVIVPTAHKYYNPNLKVLGVVINKWSKTNVARSTKEIAKKTFGSELFKTEITRSVRIGELASTRGTVDYRSPKTKSDAEFTALAEEIYKRMKR